MQGAAAGCDSDAAAGCDSELRGAFASCAACNACPATRGRNLWRTAAACAALNSAQKQMIVACDARKGDCVNRVEDDQAKHDLDAKTLRCRDEKIVHCAVTRCLVAVLPLQDLLLCKACYKYDLACDTLPCAATSDGTLQGHPA